MLCFFFLCLLSGLYVAEARSGDSENDLMDAFEDMDDAVEPHAVKEDNSSKTSTTDHTIPPREPDDHLRLGGQVKSSMAYNFAHPHPDSTKTDWRGLSRLKAELLLECDLKTDELWRMHAGLKGFYDGVYALKGRREYTDQVIDVYEDELEFHEVYLMGGITPNLDLKLGRQIVVWGRSDNIRIVDVLNPLDMREPGITDIEYLRLPVTMTKLDYYLGPFSLSGMLIHEVRFTKNPPFGSDFNPLNIEPSHEETPPNALNTSQYALALDCIFPGWDLSFYWVDLYSDYAHLVINPVGSSPAALQKHARLNMMGSAGSVVMGNWLIKGEAAWFNGLKFSNSPDKIYNRLDFLIGMEYFGIAGMQINLEFAHQHILGYNADLHKEPDHRSKDQIHWVAGLRRNFMNEILSFALLVSVYGENFQGGAFQRLWAEYDFTDRLKVIGGIVFYQSGDLPDFESVADNDRLFFELKYRF